MDIDWSKAPEGATHGRKHIQGVDFYKRENGLWLYFTERGKWDVALGTNETCCMPRPIAWNGEGLPPVGTVCEVQHPDKSDTWCKCTILVWDSECAVFSADANYPFAYDGNGYPESFRQIRTLEQIAAEERESEIKAMADIYRDAPGLGVESGIAALYDAGYRKFEIVEEDV